MSRMLGAAAVAVFVALVVTANWLTATYGLIPVGLGLMATAGTWCAGLVLVARDLVHDTAGRLAVLGCIVVGAALSAWLTAPQLAVASGVAFAVSELADFAVYQPLRRRGWARAVLASSLVGALVDTVLFLWLAGFPIAEALPGQLFAKTVAIASVVLVGVLVRLALPRQSVHAEGA